MLKLSVFIITLLTLGISDIAVMKKENQYREIIPYTVIAAAAGLAAIMIFTEPYRGSIVSVLLKLMRVSE